jgi:hypothetical protein
MLISLHKQATTTPKVRAAIQQSDEPAWVLADRFGTTEQTIYKWRHRNSVQDRSHTPHRLQTTLTPAQEAVSVSLRTSLLLPLDDLLAVVREFLNPNASRSGLDRCLRRHGVSNLRNLREKTPKPTHKPFKAYEPGFMHIDVKYLPQMADETRHRYLFVAIDRATRWVYNTQLPQSALKARTPVLEMKEWYERKPELFRKRPYYLTGCDTYVDRLRLCGNGVVPLVAAHAFRILLARFVGGE